MRRSPEHLATRYFPLLKQAEESLQLSRRRLFTELHEGQSVSIDTLRLTVWRNAHVRNYIVIRWARELQNLF